MALTWYNGTARPPAAVFDLIGRHKPAGQGSVYVGTEGVLYSPYIDKPVLLPEEKYASFQMPEIKGDDHYAQFLDAVRGVGRTSAPFSYAGPLTEMVLLGCLATRFPNTDLKWDGAALAMTNLEAANRFVRRVPRKGWEVEGL